jgi:hypothetical protein
MTKSRPDRAEIDRLVSTILSLKEAQAKNGSTHSRRSNALKALARGRHLFEELCDWAVSDYAGTSRGRKMLARLLPVTSICPGSRSLALALQALDYGEVWDIVKPVRGKHGKPFTLAVLRLQAIKYVTYHHRLGMKKTEALKQVAAAYGCTTDAVLGWEKAYLPKAFGRDQMALAKTAAAHDASSVRTLRFRSPKDSYLRELKRRYGHDQLNRDGREHQAAMIRG